MKRIISFFLTVFLLCGIIFSSLHAFAMSQTDVDYVNNILIYKDDEYMYVEREFVYGFNLDGWAIAEITDGDVALFSADGAVFVHHKHLDEKLKEGFSFDKTPFLTTIYSPDGKSETYFLNKAKPFLEKGWSEDIDDVSTIMYAPDGRTKRVFNKYVPAERKVGWFTGEPVTMFNKKGETLISDPLDIEKHEKDGWFVIEFEKVKEYQNNFKDVDEKAWYSTEVKSAFELGFMDGIDDGVFSPDTTVTVAQGITMASRIHSAVYGTEIYPSVAGKPWYEMYVYYGIQHGFVREGQFDSYTRQLKRFEMAELFYDILPKEYYKEINEVTLIPDVKSDAPYYNKILTLYKAGITMGSDDYGTFNPHSQIKRSECAAIINRVALCENRVKGSLEIKYVKVYAPDGRVKTVPEAKSEAEVAVGWSLEPYVPVYNADGTKKYVLQSSVVTMEAQGWSTENPLNAYQKDGTHNTAVLSAEQIFSKCSSAVFTIYVYNEKNQTVSQGSGFFINDKGVAVTNYHVIDGTDYGIAQMSQTQDSYDIVGVYDYDPVADWAVLQVKCVGNDYLTIGDKSTVVSGASVFAIGSPKGLSNTITQGIISNPARDSGRGFAYIQIDASITNGNSGGPLINKYGEVIGINSAGLTTDGAHINFALPIQRAIAYNSEKVYSLSNLKKPVTEEKEMSKDNENSATFTEPCHEALVQYVIDNGIYNAENELYDIKYNETINKQIFSYHLIYSEKYDQIILGAGIGSEQTFTLNIKGVSDIYSFVYSMTGSGVNMFSNGVISAGYDVSADRKKAVVFEKLIANNKDYLFSELHYSVIDSVAEITAGLIELVDEIILEDSGLSIKDIYNIR